MKVLDYGLIAVTEELQQIAFTALDGSESNDNSIQLEDTCIVALDKHVKKVLSGIDKQEALQKSVAKNVTNCRHRIIKEFMRSHMVNKRRHCPGCKASSRDVRSEYNSRVFLKALSAREANKWVNTQVIHEHLKKHSVPVTNGTEDSVSTDDGLLSQGKNYILNVKHVNVSYRRGLFVCFFFLIIKYNKYSTYSATYLH